MTGPTHFVAKMAERGDKLVLDVLGTANSEENAYSIGEELIARAEHRSLLIGQITGKVEAKLVAQRGTDASL